MNSTEKKKMNDALGPLARINWEIGEFPARAKATAAHWTAAAALPGNAAKKKSLTSAAVTLADVVKRTKVVAKDTAPLMAEKHLSDYTGTAQQYRDKVVAKRLASLKALDLKAQRLIAEVAAIEDEPFKFRPKQDPPSKVNVVKTMEHLKAFSDNYNELRTRLANL